MIVSIYKYTPDLLSPEDLTSITVGRQSIITEIIRDIDNAAIKDTSVYILLVGQRGIGKTHTLLSVYHHFKDSNKVYPIRLSEEEYSITTVNDLFIRILTELQTKFEVQFTKQDAIEDGIRILNKIRKDGKMPTVFVDNLQMLFYQLNKDLPKLRSILQEHNLFSIIGSALSTFQEISSYQEPFYNFFEVRFLRGLSQEEVRKLVEKRLQLANKREMLDSLSKYEDRIKGVHILTGGNPRLVHSLCEILISKTSFHDVERSILELLDQLTPYFQSRMDFLPTEKRKLLDILALSLGPLSPTELADEANMKRNVVITQLRRLEADGLVETLRFKDQRTTRYQISERLYRIWREMRSPIGVKRINLLIDFMRLWYTPQELQDEYRMLSRHLLQVGNISKDEARKVLTHFCYLSRASGMEILDLVLRVTEFIGIGDKKSAQGQISAAKLLLPQLQGVVRKLCELNVKIAEYAFITYPNFGYNNEHAKIILEKVELVEKNLDAMEDNEERIAHEILFQAALILRHMDTRIAEKCAYLSSRYEQCTDVMILKASILSENKKNNEALIVLNQLTKARGNKLPIKDKIELLKQKVEIYDRMRDEQALIYAKELLNLDLKSISYYLYISLRYHKYTEAYGILKEKLQVIRGLKDGDKKSIIIDIAANIVHRRSHSLADGIDLDVAAYKRMLTLVSKYLEGSDILTIYMHEVKHLSGERDYQAVLKLIEEGIDIFGSDRTASLSPLVIALQYIITKDTDALEKVHKETRDLALNIIQDIAPDIKIPSIVQDSVRS